MLFAINKPKKNEKKNEKKPRGNQDWPIQWARGIERWKQNRTKNQNNTDPTKTQSVNQGAREALAIRESINKKSLKIPKG